MTYLITLHDANIKQFPLDNGLGVLKDVISAQVEEELNGLFDATLEYDIEGALAEEIVQERIIKLMAQDKLGYQLFRIHTVEKSHEGDRLIVYARHITYDLADNFVEELVANQLTKKQVMERIGARAVEPHPFNITSSNTTTVSSTRLYRTNPLQMIGGMDGSVLQIWGGQVERDNFNLVMHDRRGHDDGVTVTYEKNITGLNAEFDYSGLVTRIFPFVLIEATEDEPERLITVNGKYIDSPLINAYNKVYMAPVDYSHDDRIDTQDKTDAQIRTQLQAVAGRYFDDTGNDKPRINIDVKFAHLWDTEEYREFAPLEQVGMGDTVTVKHSRLGIDVTATVNYIKYDAVAGVNIEVGLGDVKADFSDNVSKIDTIERKVEQAESNANQAIISANGKNTTYYGPDEPSSAQKGDLWFKIIDGQYTRTYRFDGIEWQLIIDMDSQEAKQEAQQAKDDAQSAVDRANQATQQATDAINQAQTAFDEAQDALGTANNALTQATNAFTTANQAFSEVESLSTMVDENTGEISTIKQSVIGLQTRVSDNEGNISNLTQIAQGLQTQVTDIEGNVSTLQQTASGLQSSVTNLQNEFDNLEIVGKNLVGNFNLYPWGHGSGIINKFNNTLSYVVKLERHTNYIAHRKTADYNNRFWFIFIDKDTDDPEDLIGESGTIRFRDNNALSYSFNSENYNWLVIYLTNQKNVDDVEKAFVKLEKGNKATDWTPAPEDIDHQFSTITQTIDSITTRVGDAEGNITALQQTSSSLAARLTDAEGNITTITATVDGLQTTVTNVQGDVSSVTQLANALQTRMTNAEGDISTLTQTASSLQSTVSSLQDEWDNLEIGGRNYILHNLLMELPESTFGDDEYGRWYQFRANRREITKSDVFEENTQYTISFELEAEPSNSRIQIEYTDGTIRNLFAGKHEFTTPKDKTIKVVRVTYRTPERSKLYNPMLVKGNKATDWTPAPEDMATQSQITQLSDAINLRVEKGDVINQINISDENILIDGNKLHITATTTIDNGVIKSAHIQSLDAGKITTGTLDAALVSVINLSANSIVGGILQSQNSNTTFNLNTGELSLENNDITFGTNANINFMSTGNRLTYRYTSGITRSSGLGVGLALGGEYPYAFLGTTGAPDLDTLSQWFSGFIANTTARIAEGGANSVTGNRFQFRNTAVGFDKVIEVDFFGSRPYIAPLYPASYNHDLGTEDRPWDRLYVNYMRVIGNFTIRNRNNNAQGWGMETSSQASDRGIAFYPLDPAQRNYDIGRSTHRINWIYLKNHPSVSSDERLKEDITSVDLGLDFIRDLELNSFRLKTTTADLNQGIARNKKQYGIIAQQLRDTLVSHGVDVNDITMIDQADDGMYSVQYEQLIPIAFKGIQDLDLKIESVKDDVEWLKLENQYLKQKVKQLEEMIA